MLVFSLSQKYTLKQKDTKLRYQEIKELAQVTQSGVVELGFTGTPEPLI